MSYSSDDGWLRTGFYIRLHNQKLIPSQIQYYTITDEEKLPAYVFAEFGTGGVTSAGNSGWVEVADVNPTLPEGHLFQLRFGVATACWVYVQQPSGVTVWGTDRIKQYTTSKLGVGYVDQETSPFVQPTKLSELFVDYNNHPWLLAYNPTGITLKPRVRFIGKMFEVEKITDLSFIDKLNRHVIPWTPVTVSTLPRKGAST